MLEVARPYAEELANKFARIALNPKYKYYICNTFVRFGYDYDNSTENSLDMISIDELTGEIYGYFSISFDRKNNRLEHLEAICFKEQSCYTFKKDLHQFLHETILLHGFNKLNFGVVIGSPHEKMYDRIVKDNGGRVVGVFEKHVRLWDGDLYDIKFYEVPLKWQEEYR